MNDERNAGAQPRRLYRRKHGEEMLGGVCAGLADYFHIDVTIVRVLAVMLALVTGGAAVVLYLAMVLIMPVATAGEDAGPADPSGQDG